MTRGLQRTTFNRSGLVRILSETLPEAIDPHYDFGQRLGQWLDFTDALDLFSVLNASQGAAAVVLEKPATGSALTEQLARARSACWPTAAPAPRWRAPSGAPRTS